MHDGLTQWRGRIRLLAVDKAKAYAKNQQGEDAVVCSGLHQVLWSFHASFASLICCLTFWAWLRLAVVILLMITFN
jgi:hypothetical protein